MIVGLADVILAIAVIVVGVSLLANEIRKMYAD